MIEVHSKALDKSIETCRIIGEVKGILPGPTLIFMGGIHGNEPAGVFALHSAMQALKVIPSIKGHVYALAGNLSALKEGIRFCVEDLNRVWTSQRMNSLPQDPAMAENSDIREQIEVFRIIRSILESDKGLF